jgi:hypothetical protein
VEEKAPSPPPEEEEEEEVEDTTPFMRSPTPEEKAHHDKLMARVQWYLDRKIIVLATLILERTLKRHLTPAEYAELDKILKKNIISFLIDPSHPFLKKLGITGVQLSDGYGADLARLLMHFDHDSSGTGPRFMMKSETGEVWIEWDNPNKMRRREIPDFEFKLPPPEVWKERYDLEGAVPPAPKPAESPKPAPKPAPKPVEQPAGAKVRRRPRNEEEAIAVFRERTKKEPSAVEKQILKARKAWSDSPVSLYKLADDFSGKYSSSNYSGMNRLFGKFGLVGHLLPELSA